MKEIEFQQSFNFLHCRSYGCMFSLIKLFNLVLEHRQVRQSCVLEHKYFCHGFMLQYFLFPFATLLPENIFDTKYIEKKNRVLKEVSYCTRKKIYREYNSVKYVYTLPNQDQGNIANSSCCTIYLVKR